MTYIYRRNIDSDVRYSILDYGFGIPEKFLKLAYAGRIPKLIKVWLAEMGFSPAIEMVGQRQPTWAAPDSGLLRELWAKYPKLVEHISVQQLVALAGALFAEVNHEIDPNSSQRLLLVALRDELDTMIQNFVQSVEINQTLPDADIERTHVFEVLMDDITAGSRNQRLVDLVEMLRQTCEHMLAFEEAFLAEDSEFLAGITQATLLLGMKYADFAGDHSLLIELHTQIVEWMWANVGFVD